MGTTARRLATEMDAQEFEEHYADYRADPWDGYRGDLRAGIIASTIANVNRGKDAPAFRPADFMPYLRREQSAEDPSDYRALVEFFGGGGG